MWFCGFYHFSSGEFILGEVSPVKLQRWKHARSGKTLPLPRLVTPLALPAELAPKGPIQRRRMKTDDVLLFECIGCFVWEELLQLV